MIGKITLQRGKCVTSCREFIRPQSNDSDPDRIRLTAKLPPIKMEVLDWIVSAFDSISRT